MTRPLAFKSAFRFTLVELLVVIAVIAILAGLILGSVSHARELGKRAYCVNNVKQLTMANCQYAATCQAFCPGRSGGYYSGQHWQGNRTSSSVPWDQSQGLLVEYFGAAGLVKLCPSAVNLVTSGTNAKNSGAGSYGYNFSGVGSVAYLVGYSDASTWLSGMKPEKFEDPSKCLMFGDAAHLNNGDLVEADELMPPWMLSGAPLNKLKTKKPTSSVNVAKICFRHGGSGNLSWVDGHVSVEKPLYYAPGGTDSARQAVNLGFFGPEDNNWYDPWTDSISES